MKKRSHRILVIGFVILALLFLPHRLASIDKSLHSLLGIGQSLIEIVGLALQLPELWLPVLFGLGLLLLIGTLWAKAKRQEGDDFLKGESND